MAPKGNKGLLLNVVPLLLILIYFEFSEHPSVISSVTGRHWDERKVSY